MYLKQKKGQFFLIAAVVIITIIVSIATITNYTQKKESTKLYDLGEELGIESQQVLDYGTYSELNESEMNELMETFIKNYVNYIEEDKNIYFIFGNKDKINFVGYQELNNESVSVKINNEAYTSINVGNTGLKGETQTFPKVTEEISKVIIKIGDKEYQFALKEGENFYFVIWQKIGGEKHVITN